VRSYIPR